jgi:hypothetical protein
MGDNTKSYWGRKVIVLSRDAMFAQAAQSDNSTSQYRCLRVTSPYEAAAELLAEPPLAIVVDLRCLTPGDLPLIEMARQRGLEVLAVGAVPLGVTTTDLSGVRLSARDHISVHLENLASLPLSGEQVPVSPQTDSAQGPELSSLAQWINNNKTSPTVRTEPQTPTPPPARTNADPPVGETEPETRANDATPIDSPNDLLTREELTALLEDQ